jgi:hypothetical protein
MYIDTQGEKSKSICLIGLMTVRNTLPTSIPTLFFLVLQLSAWSSSQRCAVCSHQVWCQRYTADPPEFQRFQTCSQYEAKMPEDTVLQAAVPWPSWLQLRCAPTWSDVCINIGMYNKHSSFLIISPDCSVSIAAHNIAYNFQIQEHRTVLLYYS